MDLPLSNECKRVLAYAAEEAERLSHRHIGTEHLLLGLLREEKCFAAEILHERGLRLSTIREELARSTQEKAAPQRNRFMLPALARETLARHSGLADFAFAMQGILSDRCGEQSSLAIVERNPALIARGFDA